MCVCLFLIGFFFSSLTRPKRDDRRNSFIEMIKEKCEDLLSNFDREEKNGRRDEKSFFFHFLKNEKSSNRDSVWSVSLHSLVFRALGFFRFVS